MSNRNGPSQCHPNHHPSLHNKNDLSFWGPSCHAFVVTLVSGFLSPSLPEAVLIKAYKGMLSGFSLHVCIFVAHDGVRCIPPAYHSLEGFQHVGIFQLFEVKLESCVFWLADFFSGEGGRSSSASRDHFQCLLLENFVFWQCSLLIGSASSLECNQSGCGVAHLGYAMSISSVKSHNHTSPEQSF